MGVEIWKNINLGCTGKADWRVTRKDRNGSMGATLVAVRRSGV
jgi:hypothetical protein